MAIYHISPKTLEPAICRAKLERGNCPFGGEHFSELSEARAYAESEASKEFGGDWGGPKKPIFQRTPSAPGLYPSDEETQLTSTIKILDEDQGAITLNSYKEHEATLDSAVADREKMMESIYPGFTSTPGYKMASASGETNSESNARKMSEMLRKIEEDKDLQSREPLLSKDMVKSISQTRDTAEKLHSIKGQIKTEGQITDDLIAKVDAVYPAIKRDLSNVRKTSKLFIVADGVKLASGEGPKYLESLNAALVDEKHNGRGADYRISADEVAYDRLIEMTDEKAQRAAESVRRLKAAQREKERFERHGATEFDTFSTDPLLGAAEQAADKIHRWRN